MAEPFSLIKAGKSFISGLDWFKSIMIGLKIVGVLFIGITIWRAWFMPTNKQTQKTAIVVQSGGTLKLDQSQKQGAGKKEKSIFTELYIQGDTDKEVEGGFRLGYRF